MAETGIKSNSAQAAHFYERGVAAARGGQRRVAAGLLSRAVQLDPRHEQAWLWLSGVLDEPKEIAFCLRSALSVNPHNERARKGLAWLEQRELVAAQPVPEAVPDAGRAEETDESQRESRWRGWRRSRREQRTDEPERDRESWWIGWRRSRRELSRAWMLVWSALIVIWVLLLGLNYVLRETVQRNETLALAANQPQSAPTVVPASERPAPVISADLGVAQQARALAYLSAIVKPREDLRAAVDAYREITNQPGSFVAHAAAARTLADQINTAYNTMSQAAPPSSLADAHTEYLKGLEQERAALADLLDFYGSFDVQLSNRAVLRLLDADARLGNARASFAAEQISANIQPVQAFSAR